MTGHLLLVLGLATALPAFATDTEDVRKVMGVPAQTLVTECDGTPCLVWAYQNRLDGSLVLMLVFDADGALTSATNVMLGPDGNPVASADDTEGFRAYLKAKLNPTPEEAL
jgi:hypothetical protein